MQTVRQVVDVVSKYAGGALPEPARGRVRGFILKLPQRWASKAAVPGSSGAGGGAASGGAGAAGGDGVGGGVEGVAAAAAGVAGRRNGSRRSVVARERGTGGEQHHLTSPSGRRSRSNSCAGSAATSPAVSPRIGRAVLSPLTPYASVGAGVAAGEGEHGANGSGSGSGASQAAVVVTAQRVLGLATESLDMMRGVAGVVKDSLDRAELWIGRMRSVGLQRGAAAGAAGEGEVGGAMEEGGAAGGELHEGGAGCGCSNSGGGEVPAPTTGEGSGRGVQRYHQHHQHSQHHQHQEHRHHHQQQQHGGHHRRTSSSFSQVSTSDEMSVPPSPFFGAGSQAGSSSSASIAWNNGGVYTPPTGNGNGAYNSEGRYVGVGASGCVEGGCQHSQHRHHHHHHHHHHQQQQQSGHAHHHHHQHHQQQQSHAHPQQQQQRAAREFGVQGGAGGGGMISLEGMRIESRGGTPRSCTVELGRCEVDDEIELDGARRPGSRGVGGEEDMEAGREVKIFGRDRRGAEQQQQQKQREEEDEDARKMDVDG